MTDLEFGDRVALQTIPGSDGLLTIFDSKNFTDFLVRRLYFLHSLSEGAERGGHAHLRLHQFFIAISGEFVIELTRLGETRIIRANSPLEAIYVPPITWRVLKEFSKDATCLVLASESYDESDYVRDFHAFTELGEVGDL